MKLYYAAQRYELEDKSWLINFIITTVKIKIKTKKATKAYYPPDK